MNKQQYYLIEFTCKDYYIPDKKVIVENRKQLEQIILSELKYLKWDFPELEKILQKRISERFPIYVDTKKGITKRIGIGYGFEKKKWYRKDDDDYSSYMSFWCSRLTNKELLDDAQKEFTPYE